MNAAQPPRALRSPPDDLRVRAERPADAALIATVVAAAFGSPDEAQLVASIRASEHFVPELSLVAELGSRGVGHVMVSGASLHDGEVRRPVATLSPLAVMPGWQGQGIGSALVREVLVRADRLGEPLVVLQGAPAFYGPLGFEYSVPYGVRMTLPTWAAPESAQLTRLSSYDPSIRGDVILPSAFDEVGEH